MISESFKNFLFCDKCEICGKRTKFSAQLFYYGKFKAKSNLEIRIINNVLIIYGSIDNLLNINLTTNATNEDIEIYTIIISSCKFHYKKEYLLKNNNKQIYFCDLNVLDFSIFNNEKLYRITNFYNSNKTLITISTNFNSKDIELPLINFKLNSRKKLLKKLKNIELLG